MTREEVQQALMKINQAIAQLNSQLHPPPVDTAQRQELEAELQAAEQARSALEQALNNIPEPTPAPILGLTPARITAFRASHARAETVAAVRVSRAARKRSDNLLGILQPITSPVIRGGAKNPGKRKRP
jgi:hypothetical protein